MQFTKKQKVAAVLGAGAVAVAGSGVAFAYWSTATVVPYLWAIDESVSPRSTVWRPVPARPARPRAPTTKTIAAVRATLRTALVGTRMTEPPERLRPQVSSTYDIHTRHINLNFLLRPHQQQVDGRARLF